MDPTLYQPMDLETHQQEDPEDPQRDSETMPTGSIPDLDHPHLDQDRLDQEDLWHQDLLHPGPSMVADLQLPDRVPLLHPDRLTQADLQLPDQDLLALGLEMDQQVDQDLEVEMDQQEDQVSAPVMAPLADQDLEETVGLKDLPDHKRAAEAASSVDLKVASLNLRADLTMALLVLLVPVPRSLQCSTSSKAQTGTNSVLVASGPSTTQSDLRSVNVLASLGIPRTVTSFMNVTGTSG